MKFYVVYYDQLRNSPSAEDNCLQVAGQLHVQKETILLEFGLKFDDRALLKLGPKAKYSLPPLGTFVCK